MTRTDFQSWKDLRMETHLVILMVILMGTQKDFRNLMVIVKDFQREIQN